MVAKLIAVALTLFLSCFASVQGQEDCQNVSMDMLQWRWDRINLECEKHAERADGVVSWNIRGACQRLRADTTRLMNAFRKINASEFLLSFYCRSKGNEYKKLFETNCNDPKMACICSGVVGKTWLNKKLLDNMIIVDPVFRPDFVYDGIASLEMGWCGADCTDGRKGRYCCTGRRTRGVNNAPECEGTADRVALTKWYAPQHGQGRCYWQYMLDQVTLVQNGTQDEVSRNTPRRLLWNDVQGPWKLNAGFRRNMKCQIQW